MKLTPANSGAFYVDRGDGTNIPYQRGQVLPDFEIQADGFPSGKMALRNIANINALVTTNTHYSQIINGLTGVAFVSLPALVSFCVDYLFRRADTPGSLPVSVVRPVTIATVPVNANQKPPGTSIQDDAFKNTAISALLVMNDMYYPGQLDHNPVTGVVQGVGGQPINFQNGDYVTFFGYQTI